MASSLLDTKAEMQVYKSLVWTINCFKLEKHKMEANDDCSIFQLLALQQIIQYFNKKNWKHFCLD